MSLRKLMLPAFLLALGCLCAPGVFGGEKKQEEKKKAEMNSKFTGKPIELTLKDGKVEFPTEFTEDDMKFMGRFHYKVFTVQLEKGKLYRIDHRGTGGDAKFDPFLFLEDADGTQLEADDDSGGGLNARIVFKAAKTGPYRIVATTFVPSQTGKFTLDIGVPDAKDVKVAELKASVLDFGNLTKAQRKQLATDLGKLLESKDGDLTVPEFGLITAAAGEAEFDDLEIAREIYKQGIKHFSAAKNADLSEALTGQLEGTLKSLDKLGKIAEIKGKTTDGKDFDLKNLKGKVVLVDFWATWCGPCIAELPNMEKAYAKYHSKGFEIIGVSLDKEGDDEKLTKFMANRKMPWSCISIEDSRKLADKYEVNSIPYPMLVGPDGRTVSVRARGPQLDRLLARMLKDKK